MLRTAAVTQERADIWVDFSRHPSSEVCRLLASVVNVHGIAGLHLEVLELVQQAIEELRSTRCLADDHNCLPVAVAGVSHAIVEPSVLLYVKGKKIEGNSQHLYFLVRSDCSLNYRVYPLS